MNVFYYDQWYKKRLAKILNIFGEDWFEGKKILELGACHGIIGSELLKLGSEVTFTDLHQENLDVIRKKLSESFYTNPNLHLLNQEKPYSFNVKFDLVLHLGVLYHIENWKQDLKCAIESSKITILETGVNHMNLPDRIVSNPESNLEENRLHMGFGKASIVTQESIENYITSLGAKFIRFDDKTLNVSCTTDGNNKIYFLYDWDYNSVKYYNKPYKPNFRRFYLIVN